MRAVLQILDGPTRQRFFASLLLSAVAGGAGIVLLGLSGWFLTAAALAGVSGAGLSFNHLYPSAGVRAAALTRVIARYLEQLLGHEATLRFSSQLRPRLFLAEANATAGLSPLSGGALAALIDDVEAVEGGFLRVLTPMVAAGFSALVALGYIAMIDIGLLLLTAVALLLCGVLLPHRAAQQSAQQARQLAEHTEQLRQTAAHLIENAIELDVLGAFAEQNRLMGAALADHQQNMASVEAPFRRLGAVNAAVGGVIAFVVLALHAQQTTQLALAAGGAIAVLAAFDVLGLMARVFDAAPRSVASAHRLADRLNSEPAVSSPLPEHAVALERALPLVVKEVFIQPGTPADQPTPMIGPLNVTLQPNSVTLLRGPSGSGKSTLLETLLRLRPPATGQISYAGVDFNDCRTPSVLSKLAIAPQFPAFLAGTVRDQFKLADPDIIDSAIEQLLGMVNLSDRLDQKGLDNRIGEEGHGLSGGELRRLGIARALAVQPQLLLLDEPFAGLEPDLALLISQRLADWARQEDRALVMSLHDTLPLAWGDLKVQVVYVY